MQKQHKKQSFLLFRSSLKLHKESNSIYIYTAFIYRFLIIHIYKSLASLCKWQRLFFASLRRNATQRKKKNKKKEKNAQTIEAKLHTQQSLDFFAATAL